MFKAGILLVAKPCHFALSIMVLSSMPAGGNHSTYASRADQSQQEHSDEDYLARWLKGQGPECLEQNDLLMNHIAYM
jgi:hypothetical protein